ncbi:MAG: phospholipase D-like domain-containing protein, partial [Haloarculaceae archaeon]
WDGPYLLALRRAARRGVEVRVLLSGAWYAREENRRTVDRLNEWAGQASAPLTARVADPGGRYDKIHAKGAIVDDRVLLGSLNWNAHAAEHNREVVLVLHGESVASYYREVYDADWNGGRRPLPVGPVGALVAVAALAAVVARRIEFE